MGIVFKQVFKWLATKGGTAIVTSVVTLASYYIVGDAVTQTSANIFGSSEDADGNLNPNHKANSELFAMVFLVGASAYLVAMVTKLGGKR